MGPRSHERGNILSHPAVADPTDALQWGRVLMNAETNDLSDVGGGDTMLQWGRVLMNAETLLSKFEATKDMSLQWGRVLMNAETQCS